MKDYLTSSEYHSLINGGFVDGPGVFTVINPATEQPIATISAATPELVDQAVTAAHAAFPAWRALGQAGRRAVLAQIAEITNANMDELAIVLSQETGKPMPDAMFEIGATAGFFEYAAHVPTDALDPAPIAGSEATAHRLPLGVVAAIMPWNFPVALMSFKAPSALLAGNTMVLKPAPTTPLTTLRWGALINEVVPAGVINVIADAGDLGSHLTTHPLVRKVSFTGSAATGRHVMKEAADDFKRVTLELGGNDPAIVLADADLDAIITPLFEAGFMNNGQTCSAVKRVYVHKSKHDALVRKLADMAKAAKVGPATDGDVKFGPLQNKRQFDRVIKLLEEAINTGAIVEAGGDAPTGPGYFLNPTILSGVKDGQRIVDEEQFGPILPVIAFDNIDEVIATINASPFGLGASVWGSDEAAIMDIVDQIEAGSVWINKHFPVAPNVPFGGARQSGVGSELGTAGLLEFTQLKVVS